MPRDLGKFVRQLRKAAGMTQMELAERMDISYQQVQKYEKGTSKFSVPRLRQVAEIFSIPLTAFFDEPATRVAEREVPYHGLSDQETQLLTAFKRLRGKPRTREKLIKLLKHTVDIERSS
jgi:transcriptional regulator with XRE-family HTH domain